MSTEQRKHPQDSPAAISVKSEHYGQLDDGREVQLFTIENGQGVTAQVTNYGAILTALIMPDREGERRDVVHGFDDLAGWLGNEPYFGATVGRFGNRIAAGRFSLDGKDYSLATNNEPAGVPCALHGGLRGFSHVLWTAKIIAGGVQLSYHSPDGEEGYPGALEVTVSYLLNEQNELTWKAEATTTQATPINIINHSYWNLSGDPTTSVADHLLTIASDHILEAGADMIPTGALLPVAETPMDFRKAHTIGARIEADYSPLQQANGYDHSWVLPCDGLTLAAKACDPISGRCLKILTDQPALQFYTANFLDGHLAGKSGVRYQARSAFCLETEGYPDAPNNPKAPNCILRPGERYQHTMVHQLSW